MLFGYKSYLKTLNLVMTVQRKFYPEVDERFQPGKNAAELIDQLDNMIAGLQRAPLVERAIVTGIAIDGRTLFITLERGGEKFTISAYRSMDIDINQLREFCVTP